MDMSSLNVDVLLHLMKFLDPDDRFNLVLSGTLKGFENANEGIDLRQRIKGVGIELGLRNDSTCQLEIRSLDYQSSNYFAQNSDCRLIILEGLVDNGYFQNNRQMIVTSCWPSIPRLFQVILSMTDLKKLLNLKLRLAEDLPQLIRSCPKLTELRLKLVESQELEMNGELRNELRPGLQRLRLFELEWVIHSWPVMQEIFTWLKECVQLTVRNCNYSWSVLTIDGSWTLDPDLSQNLRFLCLFDFPVEFVKWILPSCSNIDILKLYLFEESNDLHKEIARLETLRDLEIGTYNELFPKEVTCVAFRTSTTLLTSSQIIRSCRQVEILRISATITLRDLADLEHFENLKEAHLRWLEVSSVKEALSMLEKCTNLRRITLESETMLSLPTAGELCDFIMEMKHLTFLHIIYCGNHKCYHSKSLVDEVKAFVLLRRPNFEFYVSCCEKFGEFRVPREFFYY